MSNEHERDQKKENPVHDEKSGAAQQDFMPAPAPYTRRLYDQISSKLDDLPYDEHEIRSREFDANTLPTINYLPGVDRVSISQYKPEEGEGNLAIVLIYWDREVSFDFAEVQSQLTVEREEKKTRIIGKGESKSLAETVLKYKTTEQEARAAAQYLAELEAKRGLPEAEMSIDEAKELGELFGIELR